MIAECTKRIENEKKRKQQGLVATTDSGKEEANLAHDGYALTITYMDYESLLFAFLFLRWIGTLIVVRQSTLLHVKNYFLL